MKETEHDIIENPQSGVPSANLDRDPFLVTLGEQVRTMRARRGMTRKSLAIAASVSERHLANLEYGRGNVSVLVLRQVATALHCSLAELICDITTSSPEWLMLRSLLEHQDDAALRRVRVAIREMLGNPSAQNPEGGATAKRSHRIALIGLRGAGKSTLGAMLAEDLEFPFVELSRVVEKVAGGTISEIQALYGQNAYRRYERRALEETIQIYPEAIIATPGGIVSDPANFNLLLTRCTTVWLRATPEDHMARVQAQGDMRPMAASSEAMNDLRMILAGRAAFYANADIQINTSEAALDATFLELRKAVRMAMGKAV
jgi:XRE family transcriptional regulator, aerobic/anaerobic benzoate catabolism transcriptional regulator